jgi:hypothetical protein
VASLSAVDSESCISVGCLQIAGWKLTPLFSDHGWPLAVTPPGRCGGRIPKVGKTYRSASASHLGFEELRKALAAILELRLCPSLGTMGIATVLAAREFADAVTLCGVLMGKIRSQRDSCCIELVPVTNIRQRGNRYQFTLIEGHQRSVDHLL